MRCLKLTHGDDRLEPCEIADSRDALGALLDTASAGTPAAILVRQGDLWLFDRMERRISGPKKKHRAKELSAYILGKTGTPIVDFPTHSPGQLLRSVRTALENAAAAGERKAFVIALGTVFDDLWEDAGIPGAEAAAEEPWWRAIEVDEQLHAEYAGSSDAFKQARAAAAFAAGHTDPVLILGETGTGKEVLARNIHRLCTRQLNREDVLRAVNVAAIPELLLESELFGHVKGAFTGALKDKIGLWEEASGGTLLLDEIGDLSPKCQVSILRAIEEKQIRRVGSTEFIDVDTRIISATKQDIFLQVAEGTFRDDLLYRLNNGIIRTPSLCDSPRAFREIARWTWAQRIAKDGDPLLPEEVIDALLTYEWPGNVRQLKSKLQYLYRICHTLQGGRELTADLVGFVMEEDAGYPEGGHGEEQAQTFHCECLEHLRRVDRVIGAVMAAFEGFGESGTPGEKECRRMRSAANRNADMLEELCRQGALLFHSEATFAAVSRFKGALSHQADLLAKDPGRAKEFWDRECRAECGRARSRLFIEAGEITD